MHSAGMQITYRKRSGHGSWRHLIDADFNGVVAAARKHQVRVRHSGSLEECDDTTCLALSRSRNRLMAAPAPKELHAHVRARARRLPCARWQEREGKNGKEAVEQLAAFSWFNVLADLFIFILSLMNHYMCSVSFRLGCPDTTVMKNDDDWIMEEGGSWLHHSAMPRCWRDC